MHLNAGAGRPPNPDRSAVRHRNPSPRVWRTVPNTPFEAGRNRELPSLPRGKGLWHERTLRWWDNVRTMPHARLWTNTDWDFASDTALLHHALWQGDTKLAAELRIRERLMGLTDESRVAASIKYSDPEPENTELAEVTPIRPEGKAKVAKATPRSRVRAIDPDGA